MPLSPEHRQNASIFFPYMLGEVDRIAQKNIRFVHYTSADAAVKILTNRCIWLRQTPLMNDSREILHGLECLRAAYHGPQGAKLLNVLHAAYPGINEEIAGLMNAQVGMLSIQTFVGCFSEHGGTDWDAPDRDAHEDAFGRLSMWRAYGRGAGVALVMNSAVFHSTTQALSVFTSPVAYLTADQMGDQLAVVATNLEKNQQYLTSLGRQGTINTVLAMFKFAAVATKHPGFCEEREWRAVALPSTPLKGVTSGLVTLNGIPQHIQSVPLKNVPEEGLFGLDPAELIERVIIGPTEAPSTIIAAIAEALVHAGVPVDKHKIVTSNVPLRGQVSATG